MWEIVVTSKFSTPAAEPTFTRMRYNMNSNGDLGYNIAAEKARFVDTGSRPDNANTITSHRNNDKLYHCSRSTTTCTRLPRWRVAWELCHCISMKYIMPSQET